MHLTLTQNCKTELPFKICLIKYGNDINELVVLSWQKFDENLNSLGVIKIMVVVLVLIKRLNSIKTACKPFGLHQPIRTCHIGLLLKFIVKSIHPNSRSSGRSRHLSKRLPLV